MPPEAPARSSSVNVIAPTGFSGSRERSASLRLSRYSWSFQARTMFRCDIVFSPLYLKWRQPLKLTGHRLARLAPGSLPAASPSFFSIVIFVATAFHIRVEFLGELRRRQVRANIRVETGMARSVMSRLPAEVLWHLQASDGHQTIFMVDAAHRTQTETVAR